MAANRGDVKAQSLLGKMYLGGYGIDPDFIMAERWLFQASKQNDPESLYLLGSMYEHGIGVSINLETAKKWYKLAAARGHQDAKNAYDQLVKHEMKIYK